MELIVDIPDETYQQIKGIPIISGRQNGKTFTIALLDAIRNGTPLPKGHGDLKDVDAIHEEIHKLQSGIGKDGGAVIINKDQYKGLCYARGIINEAPVIIESDKEG